MEGLGPRFYAVRVGTRDDGVSFYLSDQPDDIRRGRYKRATLDEAATYPDRERAEMLLDVFPEGGEVQVVELRGVGSEPGRWRGWHQTRDEHNRVLHGPDGQILRQRAVAGTTKSVWVAWAPEVEHLRDRRGGTRKFGSAFTAQQALTKAVRQQFRSAVGAARARSGDDLPAAREEGNP